MKRGTVDYVWAAGPGDARRPSRARYVLSLPKRLVRVVRWNRGAIPAARIYFGALVIGLAVGLALYFAFDWVWWPFPVGALVITALIFAGTAFTRPGRRRRTLDELRLELDHTFAPGGARERYHRREARRYAAVDFPLYGLPPEWVGLRYFGSSSSNGTGATTSLGLAHQPSGVHGPRLDVETHRDADVQELLANIAMHAQTDEPHWTPLTVRIDGEPLEFQLHRDGGQWWAWRQFDDHAVAITGEDYPADDIELVRVTDLRPYADGLTELDRRLGAPEAPES